MIANRQVSLQSALLALLAMSIFVSPRIRIGFLSGRAIDLRLQELILIAALFLLVISGRKTVALMGMLWSHWLAAYLFSGAIIVIIHALLGDVELIRGVAFFIRGVEPFLLAIAVASLWRARTNASSTLVLRTIHLGLGLNVMWVLYQLATGTHRTLFADSVSQTIESYGPRLIGEPSSFGTGIFFALMAVISYAEFKWRFLRLRGTIFMFTGCAIGSIASQSRVSIGAVALVGLAFVLRSRPDRKTRWLRAILIAGFIAVALQSFRVALSARFSQTGIQASAGVRATNIWKPLLGTLTDSPIIGIGPGALGTLRIPATEAHNVILRIFLDYGLVVGCVLIALLATIVSRSYRIARQRRSPCTSMWATSSWFGMAIIFATGLLQDSFSAVMTTSILGLIWGCLGGELIANRRVEHECTRSTNNASP